MQACYFALAFGPPLPITEAASEAALRAVATTAPAATFATFRTAPGLLGAGLRAGFAAAGATFLGAALPKAALVSFERSETAGPAPALACVALAAFGFAAAGFLALVAIGKIPYAG
ncbi:hypothetical protein [Mesorhizobium sp. dw_380]|uniref:hypothetical protein n=1 Tax=Mesorhizobium sp. dw_380 TaxID=2812001 RepID=UPI001BDEFCB7|nr:hypothetical protein [Mesorhizobium sp. dw_380]